jgi:hypothetical protein
VHVSAVSIGESNDQNSAFPFSVEVWARPRVVDGTYRYLFSRERTVGGEREGTGLWLSSHARADVHRRGSRRTFGLLRGRPRGRGAVHRQRRARAHVATEYADATKAPCTTIADADGASYTPVLDDLGRTLVVNVTAPGAAPITAQSFEVVTHGIGDPLAVDGFINDLTEGETVSGEVLVTATLYGLAPETVGFEIDRHIRYTKVAEAPYQYLWNTTTSPNGPHIVAVVVRGVGGAISEPVTVNVEN